MFQSPIETPEQKARDKWTRDVQAKIRSCEEDQWMPLAQASALRQLRIELIESIIVFILLPPFFIIAGLGLMTRARGIITRTAGKFITTFGALLSVFAIAHFFAYISHKFNSVVITYLDGDRLAPDWYIPRILNGPRLDVIFATLAPVGIVLWWRRPTAGSKPVVLACCLGIAAGLAPVVTQIISWPFIYYSPDGVRATAIVATIGAASLSGAATTRILKGDTGVKQNKFDHTQKGLRRLYITLLIPWVAWFGYAAYESSHSIRSANSQRNEFFQYTERLDRLDDNNQARDAIRRWAAERLELMRLVWDVRTNDELLKSIDSSIKERRDRLTNDVYAVLAGVMPFLLYPIALWVIAGFWKPTQENEAKTPTSP